MKEKGILSRFSIVLLILLALVLINVFGMGKYQIILILGILFIPSFARVVRGEVAKERNLN